MNIERAVVVVVCVCGGGGGSTELTLEDNCVNKNKVLGCPIHGV
jgi:hypothetical protein